MTLDEGTSAHRQMFEFDEPVSVPLRRPERRSLGDVERGAGAKFERSWIEILMSRPSNSCPFSATCRHPKRRRCRGAGEGHVPPSGVSRRVCVFAVAGAG
jgi:hypothetical protein